MPRLGLPIADMLYGNRRNALDNSAGRLALESRGLGLAWSSGRSVIPASTSSYEFAMLKPSPPGLSIVRFGRLAGGLLHVIAAVCSGDVQAIRSRIIFNGGRKTPFTLDAGQSRRSFLLTLLPSPVDGLEGGGDEKRAGFVTMHESAMRVPGLRVPIPLEAGPPG
jgi:hypothetical protein